MDVAEQQLTKTISSTGIGTTDGVELDMNELLLTISIVLIAIGFVLMAMTFLGCCGACYKIKCLLKTVRDTAKLNVNYVYIEEE